jgi:transglutaminase-like putative cysteine protease
MDFVYTGFTYQQHVTTVSTKVPEVLAARTGVCQDFAHVLVGLCRSVEIPARYVSGYIVADSQQQAQDAGRQAQWQRQGMGGQSQWQSQDGGGSQSQWQSQSTDAPPTRGTGASHAWIEAYTPTHGWRGFDPTNNLLATTNHVKMAIGRDYSDVPPTRGTFRGAAEESFAVEVLAVRRD